MPNAIRDVTVVDETLVSEEQYTPDAICIRNVNKRDVSHRKAKVWIHVGSFSIHTDAAIVNNFVLLGRPTFKKQAIDNPIEPDMVHNDASVCNINTSLHTGIVTHIKHTTSHATTRSHPPSHFFCSAHFMTLDKDVFLYLFLKLLYFALSYHNTG